MIVIEILFFLAFYFFTPVEYGASLEKISRYIIIGSLLTIIILSISLAPYPISEKNKSKMTLLHFTNKNNKNMIMSENTASLNISSGFYQNIGNIFIGKCLFMFCGSPNKIYKLINLIGKYNNLDEAVVTVKGKDIQGICYGRLIDNSILIPSGYIGPAIWDEPGSDSVSVSRK
ncbi:hypothetical protein JRX38_02610 [Gluconobacter cerinus]|uniref:hypothetical protein n=1 Tax=Gluconobacter cerinus TaxID=38307 RepID=UPI00193F995A|nr:hypothetical protein [Gluconobacter cerinus]MBM3096923.1 hypothetical protein [Gluconobacter cerinus]